MNLRRLKRPVPAIRAHLVPILIVALAACSSTDKPKPDELPPNVSSLGVREAWTVRLSAASFPVQADVNDNMITIAGADGTVVAIDALSGKEAWRAQAGAPLLAGPGSGGSLTAVITINNDLVVLQSGKVLWTQRLSARSYTPPLVAGRRVFVQAADRTISAWDGQSGRRLWSQQRPAANLVLKKPGVLLAVGDALVIGQGGRLLGLNPSNGSPRWDSPIAAPRGTNDMESLVDLTGTVSRMGDIVCARSYRAAIGCVDTSRGVLVWTKPAVGTEGLSGDDRFVYGTETNGDLVAWRRTDGERAWLSQSLKNRTLTAPLAFGRALVIGERTGTLHFVSREDGSLMNRITPDGSAIDEAPVRVGKTVVVVTRNGGVFGYRPE